MFRVLIPLLATGCLPLKTKRRLYLVKYNMGESGHFCPLGASGSTLNFHVSNCSNIFPTYIHLYIYTYIYIYIYR